MTDFPFTLEEFTDEEGRKKVSVQPVNFTIYGGYKKLASRIYNLTFRPGDIVVATSPKSGTTWVKEMVWTIVNNVDIEASKKIPTKEKVPMLELQQVDMELVEELKKKREAGEVLLPGENYYVDHDPLETFEKLSSPRVCCTHLPISLLPPNVLDICKVIFLTRNPADLFCSLYPYWVARHRLNVDFETYFNMFLKGTASLTPYWTAVKEAWNQRHHPNLLFFQFEDLKKDLRGSITKISNHLQYPLSEEQLDQLEDHLSFESMRNNPNLNQSSLKGTRILNQQFKDKFNHMRKGIVGESKQVLNDEQKKRIKDWCDANRGDCGIEFSGSDL